MPAALRRDRARAHSWLALALAAVLVAGCSVASIAPPPATPRIFDLTVNGAEPRKRASVDWQLVVNEPTTLRPIEGDRIPVRAGGTELSYFADAVWADRLPRLLQARLIEALQRSGRFRAVGNGRDKIEADVALSLEIEAFGIEVDRGQAQGKVAIHAKLVDERRGEALASRRFAAESHAARDDAAAGVAALNEAFGALAPLIVAWAAAQPFSRRTRDAQALSPGTSPPLPPLPALVPAQPSQPAPPPAPRDELISRSGSWTPASGTR